jgi:phage terminase large subunit-like protein
MNSSNSLPQYALVFRKADHPDWLWKTDDPDEEARIPHDPACPSGLRIWVDRGDVTVIETTNNDHVLTAENIEDAIKRFYSIYRDLNA